MRRVAPPELLKAIEANDYFEVAATYKEACMNDTFLDCVHHRVDPLPAAAAASPLPSLSSAPPPKITFVDEAGHSMLVRTIFGFGWPALPGVVMSYGGVRTYSPPFVRPCNASSLRALLDCGLDPNILVDVAQKRTLLQSAVAMGKLTESLLLLPYMDATAIGAADATGYTALYLAAGRGMGRLVKILLGLEQMPSADETAPVLPPTRLDAWDTAHCSIPVPPTPHPRQRFIQPDLFTKAGSTALSNAIRHGSLLTIGALLEAGADPNQRFYCGDNAFMEGFTESRHCLHLAIMARNLEATVALLGAGADANASTSTGYGSLNFAIDVRHTQIIQELIAAGVDPNAAGHSGHTPLYCAVDRGLAEAVHLLMDCGAVHVNPYVPEMCPLDIACFRGHGDCFFDALEPNISVSGADKARLALRACQGGQCAFLESLLQRGLRVTPAMLKEACKSRVTDLLRLLLDYGGDTDDCRGPGVELRSQGISEELARQGVI
eukprot:GILI01018745.1.p1 GENE.GILI01018745.1~~GILI01018745.1.p1  ORF type:complete len:507 (-),score=85.12 GILI01018745.1:168-1646(-)